MKAGNFSASSLPQAVLLAAATALVATLGVLYAAGAFAFQDARQEEIAERGAKVMPFDLDATTHVFEPTETGGVQKVVADDPTDEKQVALIRGHLEAETEAFRRGDLSDPAAIHGEDMPGLRELETGTKRIEIRYSELSDGAQIEYEAEDPALASALHEWFDAQLSDHGRHAAEGGADDSSGEGRNAMDHSQHQERN